MNPKRPLAEALYAALSGAVLDEQGQPVPVYEHLPPGYAGGAYVLLSQYAASEQPQAQCRDHVFAPRWRVSVLVDCLTPFAVQGQASSDPGDRLTEQVQTRVRNLAAAGALPNGYRLEELAVERTDGFGEDGPDARWLHNTTRFVFTIT